MFKYAMLVPSIMDPYLPQFFEELDDLKAYAPHCATKFQIPKDLVGMENPPNTFPYIPLEEILIEAHRLGVHPRQFLDQYAREWDSMFLRQLRSNDSHPHHSAYSNRHLILGAAITAYLVLRAEGSSTLATPEETDPPEPSLGFPDKIP
ncbi:MAG: hypothetical protein V1784_04735 [bacterium]